MEQAEGISVEELQYRMLSKGDSADDYHAHLQKMKIKLLDWQAKYVCLYCSKPSHIDLFLFRYIPSMVLSVFFVYFTFC